VGDVVNPANTRWVRTRDVTSAGSHGPHRRRRRREIVVLCPTVTDRQNVRIKRSVVTAFSNVFIAHFLARGVLIGARCSSSAKRRAAFTSTVDSDPGHRRARATRRYKLLRPTDQTERHGRGVKTRTLPPGSHRGVARDPSGGGGGEQCRAGVATRPSATSRGSSGPPAPRRGPRGGAASTAKPTGASGAGHYAGTAAARPGGAGGGRGRVRPVARSKAEMASSQLVRLSSGSHVSPEASQPAQRTSTWGRPLRILNLSSSCSRAPSGVANGGGARRRGPPGDGGGGGGVRR
jgi:hypothetical protein